MQEQARTDVAQSGCTPGVSSGISLARHPSPTHTAAQTDMAETVQTPAAPAPTAAPAKRTAVPTHTTVSTPVRTATDGPVQTPRMQSFVADLKVAQKTDQLIVVLASGTSATVSFHERRADVWEQVFSVKGYIGKNGLGKVSEGDGRTPTGVYSFTQAFGIAGNPGTRFAYTRVNDTHYWVDDSASAYYNRLVSTEDVQADWHSAEHLIDSQRAYAYALALNYNSACAPGKGSAIFLHCDTGRATAGCIGIPKAQMKQLLTQLKRSARILITTKSGLTAY